MEDSDSSATMDDDGGLQIKCEADLEGAERSPRTCRQNGNASASTSVNGATTYDARKDDRYWERRRKNNEAAKRSREKRRMNDIVMEKRIVELSSENNRLRTEIERLRRLYNITDADISIALGAPAGNAPSGSNASRTTVQPAPLTPSTGRRRSLNRNVPNNGITSSTSSGSLRKPAEGTAFSDASSLASSNENEAAAEQRQNGSVARGRAHARAQSTDALAACKPPVVSHTVPSDAKDPVSNIGLRINASTSEQDLLADAGECDLATTENGGAARTLPDLMAVLGMLQNIPLLQALLKGNQPQPSANSQLSILQQIAVVQQLAGLSGSLLINSPIGSCQLTSPPLSATSNSTPSANHLLAAAKRNSSVLDLSRKPSTFDTPRPSCEHECYEENEHVPADDSQVYEENRTLRVELDQINAQVRELKEILLQRDTQLVASAGSKRHSNANAKAVVRAEAAESNGDEQDAAYSKRTKLAIVDDVNCN